MMAVTVVCDEKSMVDKAREWGHSLLPYKARSNDVGCSSGPFSKCARRGAPAELLAEHYKTCIAFSLARIQPDKSKFKEAPCNRESTLPK
jgi:hypothetical protein